MSDMDRARQDTQRIRVRNKVNSQVKFGNEYDVSRKPPQIESLSTMRQLNEKKNHSIQSSGEKIMAFRRLSAQKESTNQLKYEGDSTFKLSKLVVSNSTTSKTRPSSPLDFKQDPKGALQIIQSSSFSLAALARPKQYMSLKLGLDQRLGIIEGSNWPL